MPKKVLILMCVLVLIIIGWHPKSSLAATTMPEGTKIAHLVVAKQNTAQIKLAVEAEIAQWKMKDSIVLYGDFDRFTISKDIFIFDIDSTLENLKIKTKRTIKNWFKRPKNVQIPLVVKIDEQHADYEKIATTTHIDEEAVKERMLLIAENLSNDMLVAIPYKKDELIPLDTISDYVLEMEQLSDATINYIIEKLDGYVILPNEYFSFLRAIQSPDRLITSRDETSFIATGLYTVFLKTNVAIVERHPQLTIPPYGEKGVNVEVSNRAEKDFIIKNTNVYGIQIDIKRADNKIQFLLKGRTTANTYDFEIENEKEIKRRVIYRYSNEVKPNEIAVIQPGKNGIKLDVVRNTYEKGVFVDSERISTDLYLPEPRILLVSSQHEPEEDMDNGQFDGLPDLEFELPGNGDDELIENQTDPLPDEQSDVEKLKYIQQVYDEQFKLFLDELYTDVDNRDAELLEKLTVFEKRLQFLENKIVTLIEQLTEAGIIEEAEQEEQTAEQ